MKRRFLVSSLKKTTVLLDGEETKHAKNVLRMKSGDPCELLDGEGTKAQGILHFNGKNGTIEISKITQTPSDLIFQTETTPLHLLLSVLKTDAMTWALEKAVELGVRQITPIMTDYTVVHLQKKGPDFFQKRWQKIADQSLKQCERSYRMIIHPPQTFEESLVNHSKDVLFWGNERENQKTPLNQIMQHDPLYFFIGPEGGWSTDEIQALERQATAISLGPLILRSETAVTAIATLARHLKKS